MICHAGDAVRLGEGVDGSLLPVEGGKLEACGVVRPDGTFSSCFTQIYRPRPGDFVVGRLAERVADGWLVDVGTPRDAFLPKRYVTKQALARDNYVYCRVLTCGEGLQTTLQFENNTCRQLFPEAGELLHMAPQACVRLARSTEVQCEIAKRAKFALYIGVNGIIYVECSDPFDRYSVKKALGMADTARVMKWMIERQQLKERPPE